MKSLFDNFTQQYSLSKTLRFELRPVGKTLENMHAQLEYNKDLQTFLKDQEIEDAYQKLKPLFDELHEEFITDSLDSVQAKQIDFSEYLALYEVKKELQTVEKNYVKKLAKHLLLQEKHGGRKNILNMVGKKVVKLLMGQIFF